MKKSLSAPCLLRFKTVPQAPPTRNVSCNSLASLTHDVAMIGEISTVFHSPLHQVALCLQQSEHRVATFKAIPAPDITASLNEDLAACFITPCNDDEELPKHIRRYDNDKVSTLLHRVRRKKKKEQEGDLPALI